MSHNPVNRALKYFFGLFNNQKINQLANPITSSVMVAVKSVAYSKHTRGNLFDVISSLPAFFSFR